ncbi:type III PLP-dependent enzyme [Kitasatospora setae]|uniref:Putative diaminopimelate decarboxylase n=1 Tax=Kitasatospora setae (strain ATCC 33774 / DSM 43861 / JCM 3304 / KCC A-0304 / NBRC 14216 / KM-6054) TaxID=452652 RepID=E4N2G2_KITSK|nr:putative diaminopimelate decarboxylase [Kitasatospora setae KM-6054]
MQGLPVSELAQRFGTPLYLYDGDAVRDQYLGLRDRLHPVVEIFYSLKANPNISVCALLHRLGARAEVSSMAELVTALEAGVPADQIMFLGPGKSEQEITACLKEDIRAIICESIDELAAIDRLAADLGTRARVVLRVNPSFTVKGSGLTMGGKPRQFGIDEQALFDAEDLPGRHARTDLIGVQAYMGTRILSEEAVAENTRRILDMAERLAERQGFPLDLVDVGGGLGVAYFAQEQDLDVDRLADLVNPIFEEFHRRRPDTRVVMELGRYLVATGGVYVSAVRYVKESMGERFAITDGGTNHHMAAVGIGSFAKRNFPMRLLNRAGGPAAKWNVTGPLCTPNDTLGKGVELADDLRPGDLIGVERSGAYGPTASPVLFLSHGYPAEVLVVDGDAQLVRRRDETEHLTGPQLLHGALTGQR